MDGASVALDPMWAELHAAAEPAETSGATTTLILAYVRARGGPDAVREVLRRADVPATPAELERGLRWIGYAARIRLLEAAAAVLDEPACARAIGATALRAGLPPALVLLVRALGSPAQVYRQLPRSVPKFTTTSTMEVVEMGPDRATFRYRLHEGYVHSRLDCQYAQGLVSVVPEVFGLPPARVVHEECQSDGFEACVYHLTWATRSSWLRRWRRAGHEDPEVVALRGQLEELQSAAADLVSTPDISTLLDRITVRAAAAVLAPAYLLALHGGEGDPPVVRSRGIAPERADELAQRLLAGEDLGHEAVTVEVASSRRVHGRLAALYAPGQRGPADERVLLRAYAGHAAAALDLRHALDRSRQGESRAQALLSLAHDLRAATDPATVAQVVVAAMPGVVGCDTATVFGWDQREERLHALASAGLSTADQRLLADTVIDPYTSPELGVLLARQEHAELDPATAAPILSRLVEQLGLVKVVYLPLLAGDEVVGVAAAGWRTLDGAGLAEPLVRLQGVADYAATAMENARLVGTIRHQAEHDTLTRLPNRFAFGEALERAVRAPDAPGHVAVLFCDLDGFKQVNDSLGHAGGDELLRQVADRLLAAARPGDVVGRLGGDEFAVLVRDVPGPEVARTVADRVVAALANPFRIEGLDVRVTVSVGVAVHWDGAAPGALLGSADGAMYAAKQRGRNQVAVAHGPASAAAHPGAEPVASEAELRSAVGAHELRLHYQPLVELAGAGAHGDGPVTTVGVEALVRWEHPRLGLLPPAAFLPLAERSGVIVDLDLWAVGQACAALASWPSVPGDRPLHLAVNVSAATLLDHRLYPVVRGALAQAGLDPQRLYVEVVESRSLVDVPEVVDRLSALRQLGVRVSLDDFGTGYSTLTWLQRLPVDQIKLDRTFTATIGCDAKSRALAHGVVALARALDLEVVAEGVETPEQAALLRATGFTAAQGYLWGRPQARPPADAVPTDAVPTDAVPTDAVPTDATGG